MTGEVQSVNINNSVLNVGVLSTPQKLYKPELYSAQKTHQMYLNDRKDIYRKQEKFDFADRYKTPKSLLAIPAAGVVILCAYKILRHIKK